LLSLPRSLSAGSLANSRRRYAVPCDPAGHA
jgi:hypothetical protein